MLFNSWTFLIFLPIVLFIYHKLGHRAQNIFLIAASYIFYGWWDYRFLALIIISTVTDYFVALAISFYPNQARKKVFLLISILVNLGILGFFGIAGSG